MSTSPIYVTEAEVARLVTVKDAIEVLAEMFATWGTAQHYQPAAPAGPPQRGCA